MRKSRLEVLSRYLEKDLYYEAIRDFLREAVASKSKKDINHAAKLLVSSLINRGVSKAYLYQKTKDFFFLSPKDLTQPIESIEQLEEFLELIDPVVHEFEVYFIVSDEVKLVKDSISAFRIELLDYFPEELLDFANSKNFSPGANEVLVKIDGIRKYECFSAKEDAESRIDLLRDLYTLYFHRSELSWRDASLISQCCTEDLVIIGKPKSPMQKSFDATASYASKRLNWLIRNLNLHRDDGQSFEKFNRIADLHGISVTNDVPENQLLNLWISIETLVPPKKGSSSNINHIVTSLDPFIRLTYISRLVDRTYKDLTLWDSYITRRLLKKVIAAKGQKGPIKLLTLLLVQTQEHRDLLIELFKELKDFHLLRFRIFSLAENLATPEKIKDLIERHSKRVHWQVRRLYRTRNMLVHSGRKPEYQGALIENGHDYLDLVLDSIINLSCGPHKIRSLGQAFEFQKVKLIKLNEIISQKDPITKDNLEIFYSPEWQTFDHDT